MHNDDPRDGVMMTQAAQLAIVGLMISGAGIALLGTIASVVWRKIDLTIPEVFWAGSKIVAYPEKYVREDRVTIVKTVYLVGICLFLIGLLLILSYPFWK